MNAAVQFHVHIQQHIWFIRLLEKFLAKRQHRQDQRIHLDVLDLIFLQLAQFAPRRRSLFQSRFIDLERARLVREGRGAEAIAIRASIGNLSAVSLPLAFGAAGAALGLFAVFWGLGAIIACGIPIAARRALKISHR